MRSAQSLPDGSEGEANNHSDGGADFSAPSITNNNSQSGHTWSAGGLPCQGAPNCGWNPGGTSGGTGSGGWLSILWTLLWVAFILWIFFAA